MEPTRRETGMSGLLSLLVLLIGCASEQEEEECFTDEDCSDGQVCVITHDHEGDDHDHGGDCEDPDTGS